MASSGDACQRRLLQAVVETRMEARPLDGLTTEEASRRLKEVGPNEPPQSRRRSLFSIVVEAVREPMFLLLIWEPVLRFCKYHHLKSYFLYLCVDVV